ncbi:helix-turn-helix domain-containing protein [Microbacterium sp.]|uniref:helix-turn-helix domain-containing protein n=1 Tax=Microbacterium sp. TaxID=51671 RepID=UPI00261DA02C|nr:helix-turn-helix domain-containing protein [Microbacterium sp.]MCV0333009.1 helix-turn-helix domain-containing protein [Microbacterium sp.]MCV0375454.1 helix-turn-helix domain-containing protein [Microbacterium sp.]MCV0389191.1 helix-turn-helix domain-containing protein [Microbacterium sp.]MCV0417719.1 helix-turn-helix domain-containing protein [Microbacterium sp.]MCV0421030.1 helix-turn-helix domain-containing protein [Microbacterium sp.]
MVNPSRGVLYPARLPQFHRLPAPSSVAGLVAWFWIPEWDIEPGRSSRQEVVAYPALNLVVDADAVTLSGATTRLSHRDLRGSGWAVGALLRPAAVVALIDDPSSLVDAERVLDAGEDVADLRRAVADAMEAGEGRRERAVEAVSRWLEKRVGPVGEPARQANAAIEVLMGDGAALTTEEAATRLAVSVRTLQRMTHRHVGLSPAAMIRRRRLQEAAQRVRDEPGVDLASIAAELGYADHAHLTRDFQAVLGIAPRVYRSETRG